MPAKPKEILKVQKSLTLAKHSDSPLFRKTMSELKSMAMDEEIFDKDGKNIKDFYYRYWSQEDFVNLINKFSNFQIEKKLNNDFYFKNFFSDNQDFNNNIFKIKSCVKISPLNYYFDKIYLLNLDERKDRLEKCKNILNEKGIIFERFSAINGKKIEIDILNKYNISAGAVGCLLSHCEIIKDAKKNNYKKILIFEDDIILSDNFFKNFFEKIKNINNDWKLLYLGASQYDWNNIEFYQKNLFYSKNSLGTFAYAIDNSIYDDILNTKNIFDLPIDNILSTIQQKYYKQCFTMFPNIVIANVEDSDIRNSREQKSHSEKMKWNLINNDKNPFFSIIIPNNNDEFLNETIFSIKNQTFEDFECIIVNDDKLINNLNFNDHRIKMYDRPKFLQQNANSCRNFGINLSSGKFIIFLDSDDLLDENCLLRRKKIIDENPDYENYIFTMQRFEKYKFDMKNNIVNKKQKFENPLEDFLSYNLLWGITSSTWLRETIIKIGGFNENLYRLQDVDLHIRYLFNKNKTLILKENNPDCFYRISRYIENINLEKKIKINQSLKTMIDSYKNCNLELYPSFINFIEKYYSIN